jgi:hypothetical protein
MNVNRPPRYLLWTARRCARHSLPTESAAYDPSGIYGDWTQPLPQEAMIEASLELERSEEDPRRARTVLALSVERTRNTEKSDGVITCRDGIENRVSSIRSERLNTAMGAWTEATLNQEALHASRIIYVTDPELSRNINELRPSLIFSLYSAASTKREDGPRKRFRM